MNAVDFDYRQMLLDLLEYGDEVTTRNDRVRRLTAVTLSFDRTPLVSLRRTAWRNALREMEWFLSGSNDINDLHPAVRPWWMPWADRDGRVANNYSRQFRAFHGVGGRVADQVELLVAGVRDHPFSRRNVATTWNAADMAAPETPITNCHGTVIQAFVTPAGSLDLVTYQRSADAVCGVPHNWVQYRALLLWLAHRTGHAPRRLTWIGGDVHLYAAHAGLARRITDAWDVGDQPATPNLVYRPSADAFRADDFTLDAPYEPVLDLRAEMIV